VTCEDLSNTLKMSEAPKLRVSVSHNRYFMNKPNEYQTLVDVFLTHNGKMYDYHWYLKPEDYEHWKNRFAENKLEALEEAMKEYEDTHIIFRDHRERLNHLRETVFKYWRELAKQAYEERIEVLERKYNRIKKELDKERRTLELHIEYWDDPPCEDIPFYKYAVEHGFADSWGDEYVEGDVKGEQ